MTWLLNYAFDNNITCIFNNSKSDMPSCAIPANRTIIVNTNYSDKRELPFMIAHEIAHVLDEDTGILYYTKNNTPYLKAEYNANQKAINILLKYCKENNIFFDNYINFVDTFGIPYFLTDTVHEELENYK